MADLVFRKLADRSEKAWVKRDGTFFYKDESVERHEYNIRAVRELYFGLVADVGELFRLFILKESEAKISDGRVHFVCDKILKCLVLIAYLLPMNVVNVIHQRMKNECRKSERTTQVRQKESAEVRVSTHAVRSVFTAFGAELRPPAAVDCRGETLRL